MPQKLDEGVNYIVSGLERSGTSMLMQILRNGGIPTSYDDSRPADGSNPKGYFELEGGKIINRLMDGTFPLEEFKGSFIKITCYGLKFLPTGTYRIIYSERNIEEILRSMETMANIKDMDRNETRDVFLKLNSMIKNLIQQRTDCDVLFVNYNKILEDPEKEIERIANFVGVSTIDKNSMIATIDKKLYRQRHLSKT
jgi:hypothetical protein